MEHEASLGVVVPEAPLERNDVGGSYPAGEGWFVLNARDAQWFDSHELGLYTPFEGEQAPFSQLGVDIGILRPGEPSCMYHAEDAREDFLVLAYARFPEPTRIRCPEELPRVSRSVPRGD